ncbi:helix-turn-helix transcriptional regulator [Arthrobacter sp. NA-172]|uniref:helix-turn-helix transcriptional regulator n=1 Tax=Arthrobacter sp. NA-172 TaxID=3367524 RepID=UPI0037547485
MSPKEFSKTLGNNVRARRASLSLSQSDLADLAGVSERFVRFVEQGKATVQLEPLLAVLSTLGLELTVQPTLTNPANTRSTRP